MITSRLIDGRFSFTHAGLEGTIKKNKSKFQKLIAERLENIGLEFKKDRVAFEKWARTAVKEVDVESAYRVVNPVSPKDFEKAHNQRAKEVFMRIWNGTTGNLYDLYNCLLYTSPSPRDRQKSRMPSSA